jgi:hypothetical protein
MAQLRRTELHLRFFSDVKSRTPQESAPADANCSSKTIIKEMKQ